MNSKLLPVALAANLILFPACEHKKPEQVLETAHDIRNDVATLLPSGHCLATDQAIRCENNPDSGNDGFSAISFLQTNGNDEIIFESTRVEGASEQGPITLQIKETTGECFMRNGQSVFNKNTFGLTLAQCKNLREATMTLVQLGQVQ